MIGSFEQALQEPLLGVEEERDAIQRWQSHRDPDAIELIVRSHARQVWGHVRKMANGPVMLEDLFAEGVVGLMRAADKFDTQRGVRFSTYAIWWIRNEVSTALRRERSSNGYGWASSETGPSGEIAFEPGPLVHVQDPVNLEDVPSDAASPEEDALRRSDEADIATKLADAMTGLSSMETEVIRRRRLSAEPEPFDAIARDLEATPARVRQIETRALSRLRQGLLAHGFSLSVLH